MKKYHYTACTLVADHAPFEQEQNQDKLFISAPAIITEEVSPDGEIRCKTTHRIITINCDKASQIEATLKRNLNSARMLPENTMADFTANLLRDVRDYKGMFPSEVVKRELKRRGHSTQALEVPYPGALIKI